MGLNPPFGVRVALANKFIDKALEFKPKLLILIVPSETERLEEKKFRYDLVWEDDRFLFGKLKWDILFILLITLLPIGTSSVNANVHCYPSPNLKIAVSSSNDRSSREIAGGREIDEEPPPKVTSRRPSPKWSVNDRSSRSREVPFEKEVSGMNNDHANPGMSMSLAENFCGGQGSTLFADASRMYGPNRNRYYSTPNSGGPAHMRLNDNSRPNVSEPEERYWKDLDMRSLVRLYGQQDPNISTRNYVAGHDPGCGFGLMGSLAVSSQRGDGFVMQRYAPRLDDLNPMRMNNERPEAPVIHGNGYLDPNRGPQSGYGGDAFGFAASPRWPYS